MALLNEKVKVTFTWDNNTIVKNAVVVLLIKTNQEQRFPMIISSQKKFSYTMQLLPGKYYYHYLIDSKRMIDSSKPNERINKDIYNVINVTENKEMSDDLIILDQQNDSEQQMNQSILSLNSYNNSYYSIPSIKIQSNEYQEQKPCQQKQIIPYDNPSLNTAKHKNSIRHKITQKEIEETFSIKKENNVYEMEYSFNEISTKNNKPKVIVYNYEEKYLIPMEVIPFDQIQSDIIKLRQIDNRKEYEMNPNDIFYQPIDKEILINGAYGNLTELKEVNELSILKNIQLRLRNNKAFIYCDSIFLSFYYGVQQNERDFFLSEFIRNWGRNEALILKTFSFNKRFNPKEENERYIIRKYINVNLPYTFYKYYPIIDQFMNVITIQMKHMLHLSFYGDNNIVMNFIPLMSSYLSSNELYSSNILFNKSNIELPKMIIEEDSFIKNTFTNLQYKNNSGNNDTYHSVLFLLNHINKYLLSNQMNLLQSIKNLLIKINHINKFQDIIKLLIIAYFSCNYIKIFQEQQQHQQHQQELLPFSIESINSKNMMFYSNITILVIIKYLNHLISSQLDPNGLIKGLQNNLILLFNPTPFDEDDILLSEVIKKRMASLDKAYSSTNSQNNVDKKAISNNFKYYLNENMTCFEENLSTVDLQMITLLENVFDLTFLNSLMKKRTENSRKSTLIHSFHYSYQISIAVFEEGECEYENIKQLWRMDLGESFEKFITDEDQISHFFQITQIIDYTKSNQELNNNIPFRLYTTQEFFTFYLPILCDIDKQYYKGKDYSKKLNSFLKDIQTHQGYKEEYLITKEKVEIRYKTYEIIMSLLHNVYEEYCLKLQAKIKGKTIKELVTLIRKNCFMIQNAWRRVLYSKYNTMSQKDFMDVIVSRYKGKDPMLIMFAMKTMKKITLLEKEKENLNLQGLRLKSIKQEEQFEIIVPQPKAIKPSSKLQKPQEIKTQSINNTSIIKKSTINNTSICKNEVNSLKEKLNESREKYKELVNVIVEYEKKLENFIRLINSNQEVKDILNKNGIQIN